MLFRSLQEYVNNIHVQVYQDGRNIHSQAISSENLKYGEMMSVPLNKSIYVEPGSDYMIALRIVHEAGFRPLAMDTKPSKYRKGNLFSEDGKNWSLITDQGSVEGNFAIAFTLSPNEDMQNPELLGYNLYRDGEKINSDPVQNTFFEDMPQQEGYYQYAISAVYNEKESYKSGTVSARIFPIGDRLAPQPVEGNVSYNRNINLRWGYSVNTDAPIASLPLPNENAQIGNENPIFIFDRTTHESGESGIASDGTYLYTSSLLAAGKFNKYSLTGDFIESFVISGVDKIRDITFDGTYFYGGANESTLYQLDFTERKLIAKYSVSEIIRHTTYIPQLDNGNGGFETGDWT